MKQRRVVITGIGAITPFGRGVDKLWKGVVNMSSIMKPNKMASRFSASIELSNEQIQQIFDQIGIPNVPIPKKYYSDYIDFALIAAKEAINDSNLFCGNYHSPFVSNFDCVPNNNYSKNIPKSNKNFGNNGQKNYNNFNCHKNFGDKNKKMANFNDIKNSQNDKISKKFGDKNKKMAYFNDIKNSQNDKISKNFGDKNFRNIENRIGTLIGTGLSDLEITKINDKKISPFVVPSISNKASSITSLLFGFKGPSISLFSACATGSHSVSIASDFIKLDRADVMICGGAEKTNGVSLIHSGFKSCLALSKRFDEMEKSSRPFDVKRDGFVLSEGSGVLVLEELEFARKRGAKIYGEILGSGMSNDSFDITKPSGIGALSAMQNAFNSVRNSKFSKNDINFIVAHGTSTVIGDKAETEALVDFFGEKSKEKMTFSTKGALGHTIGASGAIDLIIGVKALKEKKIPATKNLEKEIDLKIDFVKKESRKIATKCFLANSFGFGGYNSSIIVGNQFL